MKQIMKRAWEIAKNGVAQFGGKVREYFAEALTIAWKEFKAMKEEIVLNGSEKQVAWATDIRKSIVNYIAKFEAGVNEIIEHYRQLKIKKGESTEALDQHTEILETIVRDLENTFLTSDRATFYINANNALTVKLANYISKNYVPNQYVRYGIQQMNKK